MFKTVAKRKKTNLFKTDLSPEDQRKKIPLDFKYLPIDSKYKIAFRQPS